MSDNYVIFNRQIMSETILRSFFFLQGSLNTGF